MMSISIFEFTLLCFATFRLTRLIVFDTITTFIRKPFHELIEETNSEGVVETYLHVKGTGLKYWIGDLLSCYWCVGVWSSIFLFFSYYAFPVIMAPVIIILAVAGVAAFIESIISKIIG